MVYRPGNEGQRFPVGRRGDFVDGEGALRDGFCARRQQRRVDVFSFPFGDFSGGRFVGQRNGESASHGGRHSEFEQQVAAILLAPANHVLPLFLLRLLLLVRERLGDGEVDGGAVGGPRKRVHVEFLSEERKCFAAIDGNDPEPACLGGVGSGLTVIIRGFAGQGAIGKEGDPLAVGAPAGVLLPAGVGERPQPRLCGPQPQIVAVDAVFPVRRFGRNDSGGAIRREAGRRDVGGVEVLVERDGRLGGMGGCGGNNEAEG